MTTVLRPDEQPRDNTQTKLVSDAYSDRYGRPTAGTNAAGGSELGPSATDQDASAGSVPDATAYRPDLRGNQLSPTPQFQRPNSSGASPTSDGTVK